jgi:hypothetical protein
MSARREVRYGWLDALCDFWAVMFGILLMYAAILLTAFQR